jgi:hypothetical protein
LLHKTPEIAVAIDVGNFCGIIIGHNQQIVSVDTVSHTHCKELQQILLWRVILDILHSLSQIVFTAVGSLFGTCTVDTGRAAIK